MENRAHVLRGNDNLNMQRDFIFLDTETKKHKTGNITSLSLKLGWAMYWHRPTDKKEWFYFERPEEFWDWVDSIKRKQIILFAHNTSFDMKITKGYEIMMLQKKYKVTRFYVKEAVYIMDFSKRDEVDGKIRTRKIHIWDTMNYVRMDLRTLGKSIGIPKKTIDFDTCTKEELSAYCYTDVEIIAEYIKQLCLFLETHQLSRLKATVASLSFNIFRHRFYDPFEKPFNIHAHVKATQLERASYKGGIADAFKVGLIPGMSMLLDINSMYPWVMLNNDVPTRLVSCSDEPWIEDAARRNLDAYMKGEKHLLGIAEAEIELPQEAAYILTRFKAKDSIKCGFIKGRYLAALTWPELAFVKKHGKIHSIRKLALYEHNRMFKDYVEFMYQKREEYAKTNPAFSMMAKSFMTNLYGKFGQKACKYKKLKEYAKDHPGFADTMIYASLSKAEKDIGSRTNISPDWPTEVKSLCFGSARIIVDETENNSFDSFVAVATYVTAYARMALVGLIRQAGRENVYYSDTDSIMMSVKGEKNIADKIDYFGKELGLLKIEGYAKDITVYRPKFYRFGNKFRCKGMRKDAEIISDNDLEMTVKQEQFEGFGGAIKNHHMGEQIITDIIKVMRKGYDKGHVLDDGSIIPFDFTDLQKIHNPIKNVKISVDVDLIDIKGLTDFTLTKSENKDNMRQIQADYMRI